MNTRKGNALFSWNHRGEAKNMFDLIFPVKSRDYVQIYKSNAKYFVKTVHIEMYHFHIIFREITKILWEYVIIA